jgi:SSS family solute:Na+ symporter
LGSAFETLDIVIFFVFVLGVMGFGLLASRGEGRSTEEYFLAGRRTRWWGVAASIYGSNVSANHLVGMLGIGFGVGFAQSHFELGAIAGLMILCYGFLPVYRKLRVFTLSEYLGRRYDHRSRVLYAVIMIAIMAFAQMVPGLYIGARSICVLLGGDALVSGEVDGKVVSLVSQNYYNLFVIALAFVAASYTIFGGLRAVIVTDVIQSVLLLVAGLTVAYLTFSELGGWGEMMALDRANPDGKMHLYLPSDHPDLPWTGVLSGLLFLHFFYWGTNQFIVQRALSARSDVEARRGIIFAGFLKMLIPFFAIGTGVAAFYLFQKVSPDREIDSDAAFTELVKLVIPVGYGIVGIIAAGVIGAILSSIDSMMNSAATIFTLDIYKKYINPQADDHRVVFVGRVTIGILVVLAAALAILVLDPNSKGHFFLQIVDYQSYLLPGLVVAFFMGMFWQRSTATSGLVTIVGGVVYSFLVPAIRGSQLGVKDYEMNTFHRVIAVIGLCVLTQVVVSFFTQRDAEKEKLTWSELGGHAPGTLVRVGLAILVSLVIFAALGGLMVGEVLAPTVCGVIATLWTVGLFVRAAITAQRREGENASSLLAQDRVWAGVLCGVAIFMMYYYY